MNNIDTSRAFSRSLNAEILADMLSAEDWARLKKTYEMGDLRMTCCRGVAIPKTSENGLQFFAHLAGECATAPETIWHKSAKTLLQQFCLDREISCELERFEGQRRDRWRADVYIEYGGRKIAVEIQRSYQHREKYFERQTRYRESGVECYWLLNLKSYRTFLSTEANYRIREEYNGVIPKNFYGCRPDLPIAFLELEPAVRIRGAGLFESDFESWFLSVLEGRFVFNGRFWTIVSEN